MNTIPQKPKQKCAKRKIYKTPRDDYMADKGDGRIVPVISIGANDYAEEAKPFKLHEIPADFTELYTLYDAPVYQTQFIGHGTSIDLYSRGIPELFEGLKLLCENYLVPNSEQEFRFYRLDDERGWQNIGGVYSADLAGTELDFSEFAVLMAGGQNA